MDKLLGYVSGPYSFGDVAINVNRAMTRAQWLMDQGCYVIVPHLTHFQHMAYPREYEWWIEMDIAILLRCDFLYRLVGESKGADREVEAADAAGIPVFFKPQDFLTWTKWRQEELCRTMKDPSTAESPSSGKPQERQRSECSAPLSAEQGSSSRASSTAWE